MPSSPPPLSEEDQHWPPQMSENDLLVLEHRRERTISQAKAQRMKPEQRLTPRPTRTHQQDPKRRVGTTATQPQCRETGTGPEWQTRWPETSPQPALTRRRASQAPMDDLSPQQSSPAVSRGKERNYQQAYRRSIKPKSNSSYPLCDPQTSGRDRNSIAHCTQCDWGHTLR
jgi:hypothetical protein